MAYEKRGGFADTSGQDYEVDICALLFLRGLRLCSDVHLATNHGDAGAFDDAVIIYRPHHSEKYSAILLQAKHKKNAKITPKTLKGSKNDFTLVKYFKSFIDVRVNWKSIIINEQEEELEEVSYVLYTNARADLRETAVDITDSDGQQLLSQLLLTGGRMVKISHSPVADVLSTVDSSQAQNFLSQLVLCHGQMDHDTASKFLEEEIALILSSSQENITKIRHKIITLMKSWWAESADVSYLSGQSDLWKTVVSAEIDRLNTGTIKLKSDLSLRFTESCISKLTSLMEGSKRISLIVSDEDEACILRMKLHDALEGRVLLLYGMDLSQKLGEALNILKTSFCNALVIDASAGLEKDTLGDIISEISISSSTTLIVITTEEFEGFGFNITKERCSWSDIENNCAKLLLSTCHLNLQGFKLSLQDYGIHDPCFTDALSAKHILHLAGTPNEITLGKCLALGVPYYVPRRMEKRALIKDSFFEFSRDKSVIITIIGTTVKDVQDKFGEKLKVSNFNDMENYERIETTCLVLLSPDAYDLQFEKLCVRYDCEIYMIELKDNEFLYLRSRNGLEYARKHLKDEYSDSTHLDWNTKTKNVVVEGVPGIGKSSFLTWLGCTMKSHGSGDWIVRIDLGRYTDIIRNMEFKNEEEIKTFLEYACLASDNPSGIEKALFRRALDVSGNIVLLIDAFDEISPDYTQACIRLLKNLNLRVKYKQLLVTTRPVTMLDVENALDTFAFTISGFSTEEQLLFLRNYCSNKGIDITEKNLCSVVKSVGRCLEVPLLAFIAAEVLLQEELFQKEETILYGKVKLYDVFVEKEIGIFLLEKHGMSSSTAFQSEILNNMKESLSEKLMTLAVNTVLTDEEREKVGFKKKSEGLVGSKIGLVMSSEDKVYFVHQTFAEYFFGVWLSKNFADCGNIIESKLFDDNFEFVRESFSNYLHRDLPLHSAVSDGHVLRVEKLVAEGALSSVDAGGRTAVHVAAINAEVNDTIWNMITTDQQILDKKDEILSWSALTYAEAVSNWKAVDFLLSKGSSIDCLRLLKDEKKAKGVLRDSSCNGLFRLTMTILEMHRNLLIKPLDYRGNYVLHCAAASGSVRLVSELVKAGAPLDSVDKGRYTALCVAAEKGHVDVVSFLVKHGASMEAGIASPLHFATLGNSSAVVNYLTRGEDGSNDENIPLIVASKSNDLSTVVELLKQGADVNERDKRGMTALHWASSCGNAEITQLLLNAGSQIELMSNEGTFPLMWASLSGHNNVIKILLEAGANVNFVNDDCYTALNVASYAGHAHTVQLLLRHGADVDHKNKGGRTALTAACLKGNLDVVRLLLDANATINTSDKDGVSPLMAASFMGHADLVQLFIKAGADVNITDKGGRSALMLAASNNYNEVVQVLKEAGAKIVSNSEGVEKSVESSDINKSIESDQPKIIDNTEVNSVLQRFFQRAWYIFKGCCRCQQHIIKSDDKYEKTRHENEIATTKFC